MGRGGRPVPWLRPHSPHRRPVMVLFVWVTPVFIWKSASSLCSMQLPVNRPRWELDYESCAGFASRTAAAVLLMRCTQKRTCAHTCSHRIAEEAPMEPGTESLCYAGNVVPRCHGITRMLHANWLVGEKKGAVSQAPTPGWRSTKNSDN